MVRVLVMQTMAIDPADGIHLKPQGVVQDRDELYEPLLVIERTMGNSHVKNVGQIKPAKKPGAYKISSAD